MVGDCHPTQRLHISLPFSAHIHNDLKPYSLKIIVTFKQKCRTRDKNKNKNCHTPAY